MEIKSILIIRNGAIGDVVHTTGLFRAIKKSLWSNSNIHHSKFSSVLSRSKFVRSKSIKFSTRK